MPEPTPTPTQLRLLGKEFPQYGPDVDQYMREYLGEEFFRLLEEKESGKSKTGPRPGYDYQMKGPMPPNDAADVQMYLDLRGKSLGQAPTPTPSPTPTANIPATKKEADSWLIRLLGGEGV